MLKIRNLIYLPCRFKGGKTRWSTIQRKKTTKMRALESFDDFYGSVYGVRWRNMRAALLTEHKYIALVNNFGDTEKTCSILELDGAICVKSLVNLAKERLELDNPLTAKNVHLMSEKLADIIKQQEEREKYSNYPSNESALNLPEWRDKSDPLIDVHDNNHNNNTSYNSLEKALDENQHIDNSRLIDPVQGTGGMYEFVPANRIKGMEDWVPESQHYKYYQTTTDFPLQFELETEFNFPENLYLYTYEMGNCAEFKPPKKCITGVLSHYLMDGASVLPPLLLDVRPGERVLDACAAPGGKALLMLQTLYPEQMICNDVQESRINRIRKVMQEYLFDYQERWEGKRIILNQCDARYLDTYESFDKILVDVPCTTDRHSLMEDDNNIFKPTRVKERLRLPELQAGILANCIRLLRPGGTLVYSTCTLSPVQNDGVVHMALQRVFNDYGITVTIKDLSLLIKLFTDIYKFEYPKSLKYGQMVVPHLTANFGPMYFSKITRNET